MKGYQVMVFINNMCYIYKRFLLYVDVLVMLQIKLILVFILFVGFEIFIFVNCIDSQIQVIGNSIIVSLMIYQLNDLCKVNVGVLVGFDLNFGNYFVIVLCVGWDLFSNNLNNGLNDLNLKNFWF